MRQGIAFLILCLTGLAACGLLGSGGEDAPDIPGKIVFSAEDDEGTYQIFTMNADGSDVKQLTTHEYFSVEPAWSPDGARIAFATFRQAPQGGTTLWVMAADGANQRPLVTHPQTGRPMFGSRPAWSPDGTRLAFDRCLDCESGGSNYEIFVADLQTGVIDTLVRHPFSDTHPSWSPDGSRIAFVSDREYVDADTLRFRADIYTVDVDGSNLERLTETGFARDPVWNPNGSTIGFRSSSSSLGLFQVNVQSGSIFEIEEDLPRTVQLFPMAWSSDGQKLLATARDQSKPRDYFLYIFDVAIDQTISIPFNLVEVSGADWLTPD